MNLKRFALGTIYALRLCFLVLESTVPTVVEVRRGEGDGSLDTVPAPGAKPSMTEEKRSKFRSTGGEQTTSTEYVDGNRGLPFSTKDKWGSECSNAKLQELKLYDPG